MSLDRKLWFLPKVQDIFFLLFFVAVLAVGTQMLNLDGDLPRHLLMGRYILEYKSIPTTELFIYPYLGQPYVPHEWLTDVVFYLVYSISSWAGLVLLAALLLATTFTLLYKRLSDQLQLRLPILILVAWGALATSLNWAIRPHLASMCLLAIWLLWTDDLQRGKKIALWRFPALMLLWSNLHGEFIAGILVLLAYAAGWTLEYVFDRSNTELAIGKKIWLTLFLSALAGLLNPSGAGPWLSIVGFVNNEYLMSRMFEANAPNFQNPEMRVLFSLLATSIILLAIKRKRLSLGQGFLLAGFSAMSLLAIRNIHLYGIVAPFVLAETLDGIKSFPLINRLEGSVESIEGRVQGSAWIVLSAVVLSFPFLLSSKGQALYQLKEPIFPVQAVNWLEDHPQPGHMFNNLNWGGYLGLHLWPDQLPFIDSMADTTGDVTMQYETMITLRAGWQELFEQYSITWVILPPDWLLIDELTKQGWETAYQDPTAVILVQK
jgi:hypothetical protein